MKRILQTVVTISITFYLVGCNTGQINRCDTIDHSEQGLAHILIPRLEKPPIIDGDLSDWKDAAFSDGVWDIARVRYSSWYEPRNRLTDHGDEPSAEDDLQARYYMAWDEDYLYFGAEALDNVNDVSDPAHEDSRWYFKDSVAWFIEAPRDEVSEYFGQGDNAFCFVIDPSKPDYGAWWRHGRKGQGKDIEEPLPKDATDYEIKMNPWNRSKGDFILEARVKMDLTLLKSDPEWTRPKVGDVYGISIAHCDPDGGGYGAHLIIYGPAMWDLDWGKATLVGPLKPVERKKE